MRHSLALLTLAFAAPAIAQSHSATQPDPTGTVTGHVYCSDTNEPARFAHVTLQAVPTRPSARSGSASKSSIALLPQFGFGTVETDLEGNFILRKVKPGSYYVVVDKEGYISPRDIFTSDQMADPTPQIRALVAAASPVVVVQPNQTETAQVSLIRGAAISGRILYDDGSPAAELQVKLLRKDPNGKWKPIEFNGKAGSWVATDDRGYFRVASLLADEYIVQANLDLADSKDSDMAGPGGEQLHLNIMTSRFSLPFYGSGTAHLSEATRVKLPAGQEIAGQDMTIPVAKLHKLTGRIAAGRDGHFVNAAKLSLVNRDDGTELANTEISREDGLFHFEFVPDGDYILKITDARDVTWEQAVPTPNDPFPQHDKENVIATYGNTEEPILLRGDLLDTLATISPDAAAPSPASAPATPQHGTFNGSTDPSSTQPPVGTPAPQAAPKLEPNASPDAKPTIASLH